MDSHIHVLESLPHDSLRSENEALRSETKILSKENESLRSALSIMSMKMCQYNEKEKKLHRALEKSNFKSIHIQQQTSKMERLIKVLKLSHKSFLKMEQRNKALEVLNRQLQQQQRDIQSRLTASIFTSHLVSDAADVSVDERSAMIIPSNSSDDIDDDCQIIHTTLPPLNLKSCMQVSI
jgi:chromosome segregation ATPase